MIYLCYDVSIIYHRYIIDIFIYGDTVCVDILSEIKNIVYDTHKL